METFTYKGISEGKYIEGDIEAINLDEDSHLLKEKKINYLDAPVSGGTLGAEDASLAIMVGGEEKTFKNCFYLLKYLCNPSLVGPLSSGLLSKLSILSINFAFNDSAIFFTNNAEKA